MNFFVATIGTAFEQLRSKNRHNNNCDANYDQQWKGNPTEQRLAAIGRGRNEATGGETKHAAYTSSNANEPYALALFFGHVVS